ncbi:A-kinase anchor protein 8-like isoform X2 [Spea bombifrons]|uniref:A-kinase anchor protein 8-like isoform X2 n=1 Tax=Spea bombifrons TaxID=233779 RepID=UPI00234AEA65|nr:A-kinase anchor protein 8-like isoform X2 [Spea bombifrons]
MDGRTGAYLGGDGMWGQESYAAASGYTNWNTGESTGYEPYDYSYDYGPGSSTSYAYTEKSWQNSYPTPPSDGSAHSGLVSDGLEAQYMPAASSYDVNQGKYGYSEADVGYGSRREHRHSYPQHRSWTGSPRGGYRGNYGVPAPMRGVGRPPPLLPPGQFPELAGFHGLRAFTGNSYFGGGFKQRTKRSWKDRAAQRKAARDGGAPPEKKMKKTTSIEDPEAKSEETASEGDGEADVSEKSTKADAEDKEDDGGNLGDVEKEDKPSSDKRRQDPQNRRLRDRMVERIQFVCSLCKFRTFYDDEMTNHLQSDFHKEHFRYVRGKLPQQIADFLEEYVTQKRKKTEERRQAISDLSTTIQQIYRDQDLTQDLGMEHFVKKVEAAHCAACDIFIPMHFAALQRHLKSALHNQNRRHVMEQSKKTALAVARSILNNKLIGEKLDRYVKGENPFTEDQGENTDGTKVTGGPAKEEALEDFTAEEPVECSSDQNPLIPEAPVTAAGEDHSPEAAVSAVGDGDPSEFPKTTAEGGDTTEASEGPIIRDGTEEENSFIK